MNIPEAIVSRVSLNKFQELFIQFKVKKEDITPELEKHFRDLWESGNSLALATAPFQVEERESMPEEVKPREKTVYERLRWEVVKDWAEDQKEEIWHNFKLEAAQKKNIETLIRRDGEVVGYISSKDIWTPEEAEKLIAGFQGYDS